jgi:hypothetical protein
MIVRRRLERRITPSARSAYGLRLSAFNQRTTPELNGMPDGRAAAPIVPRMLCSAVSAFTRVFDALWTCGVVRC